ncbi:hypothetical protein C8J56DRAFT_899290 [Mycena floridula]|nr:hypothetical protein C8J56DRAFT_899290 [Mycena floridula]
MTKTTYKDTGIPATEAALVGDGIRRYRGLKAGGGFGANWAGRRKETEGKESSGEQMYCFVVWQQTAHPLELQTLESNPTFDILIIEGGTSSKSTKPVYGGVRYLQKVFMEADWSGGSSSAKPFRAECATFLYAGCCQLVRY